MSYLSYNPQENKQGGVNFLLVFVIGVLALLLVFQYQAPKQPQTDDSEKKPAAAVEQQPVQNHPIETRTLETPEFSVTLTNAGGGRPNSVLIKDPDRYAEHGDFIRSQKQFLESKAGLLPFEVTLPGFGIQPETPFKTVSDAGDHGSASFVYKNADGTLEFTKTFTASSTPYVIKATFTLSNRSLAPVEDTMKTTLFIKQIEGEEPGIFTPGAYVAAKCYADGDMEYVDATDNNEIESYQKNVRWFAVDESYFAIAASADHAQKCEIQNEDGLLKSTLFTRVALNPGASQTFEFNIYMGPKESKYLDVFGADYNLPAIIDYGWMEILAKPMAAILDKFHEWTGNWGLAIILLTLIVRLFLWPIAQKSQISMMRMSKLAPLMQELQERYKDDPVTLQQKQLELYRDNKVNPFGCLPLLLQMPIFFALYRCIFVTGGLYNAEFIFWIRDLSSRDPYFVLPLFAVGLLVLQQLLTPNAAKNRQQRVMMIVMPVMFGAMMLFLPAGLNLYMVVSSLVSMIQSFYVRHCIAKEEAAGKAPEPESAELSSKDRRAAKRRQA